jgi:uncharacterized protein YheU (UPF0270 family)
MAPEYNEMSPMRHSDLHEEAVEIPLDLINPDTLRNMIEEFVTREWSELADSEYSLDEKAEQVLRQLKDRRARIVFDSTSETWNIIPRRS